MVQGLAAPSRQDEEQAIASTSQGTIFVLENAILEAAKVGKVPMKPRTFLCRYQQHLLQYQVLQWLLSSQNANTGISTVEC